MDNWPHSHHQYPTSPLRHHFFTILFCILTGPLTLAGQDYAPATERYGIDETLGLIVVHPDAEFTNGPAGSTIASLTLGDRTFALGEPTRIRYDRGYTVVTSGGQTFRLQFTRLPLFTLNTEEDIRDDPKVDMTVHYADATRELTLTGGVEYRGVFSLNFPKKTFDLEFDEDVSFGHLREDDDWILDAVYNESLRVNAYVAHRLWLDQHRLYYSRNDTRAQAGADVMFAEAFVNGRYYGLQLLSEQVDRKLLRLKKNDGATVRGELYKGSNHLAATDFTPGAEMPQPGNEEWSGWEWKYPDDPALDWGNLEGLYNFVTSSSDEAFVADIGRRVRLENVIDKLLFVNLLGMIDNSHRNLYLARYDAGEPYFIIPWDFDGSWGNTPRGNFLEKEGFWHANGLTRRLIKLNPDEFNQRLCRRYWELRDGGLYQADSLFARIESAMSILNANDVYGRERLAWPELPVNTAQRRAYTEKWIHDRVRFLDEYVCSLAEQPTVNRPEQRFIVYPNPADESVVIEQQGGFVETLFVVRDSYGSEVMRGWASARFPIDVSACPPGMYLVQVGPNMKKLIVR